MPAITLQQAYALSMGVYMDTIDGTNGNQIINAFPAATGKNKLQTLLTQAVNLDDNIGLGTVNPQTYTLVTTSTATNDNGAVYPYGSGTSYLDYLVGGDIQGNGTTFGVERKFHLTGLGILKKIKK